MLDHDTRRRFVVIGMATVLVAMLVSFVRAVRSTPAIPLFFEISGFSMAPTLMGRTEIMLCSHCLHQDSFPTQRGNLRCRCPQCGGEIKATGKMVAADQVKSENPTQQIDRGDLVALIATNLKQVTQQVVKRIVGIPGDLVDRRGSELTINGTLIHHMPWALGQKSPTVAVYRETGKGSSRWKAEGDWLVYHHINPYRASMPSPVLDDYAVNVNLSRRLEPVIALSIRSVSETTVSSSLEIVTWKPNDEGSPASLVRESRPIAIRNTKSNIDLTDLEIRRGVVYRLRPGDDRSRYPMKLGQDEYFALGDNVPISVDSRDWGPVRREQIRCSVTPMASVSP